MIDDLFSVRGKTALVTGGARGVGALIAQALVEAGAQVYLTSRDGVAAEKAAAELSLLGDCHPLTADVSSEAGCRALAADFGQQALHLLVNNAGVLHAAPLDEFDESGWRDTIAINLEAVFHLTKLLRPQLLSASTPDDPARVVNVGSIDGLRVPAAETYSYGASKAAMHHLSRHLATRLAPRITVNVIALGPFVSGMLDRDLALEIGSRTPMSRYGGIDDIAGIVRFLGSRASAYVTGTVISVDGGMAASR
ncbi:MULTISPECIES: SDR family oxidoreductase [unclassified Nocardia]|uniref:SDR family oxidoreductase n=1 Tax=unclassified Nocardia TaxID=2637762 RepID=UPI001CE3D6E0|nr:MULTISPECIES: SDR family oxidoreductase [unclassified Nocardia]